MIVLLPYTQPLRLTAQTWVETDDDGESIVHTTEFTVVSGHVPDVTQWVAYAQDFTEGELAPVADIAVVFATEADLYTWLESFKA